jgi:AraC-like DNA-binding protein
VETTARALGLSTRTLQRRLREADTTFQGEVLSARVRMAQRCMLESDASLTAIALDTGFTSPQHMATVFRRLVGQTPSAWRSERA